MPIILPNGDHLYDDSNIQELIGAPQLRGMKPRSSHPRFAAYGSVPGLRKFEDVMPTLIPRSEWSDRIKELKEKRMRVSDHIDFDPRDQNGTNFCWANGPCGAAETAQRIANQPYVQWSAASLACKINGYVNQGGWGIDAVKYMAEHGACSVDLWPNNAINSRYDTPESRADRELHQALEWIDVPCNLDAVMTVLLQPWPGTVGYNWWQHEVEICDADEPEPGVWGFRIRNSWKIWGSVNSRGMSGFAVLTGSRMLPDDCQVVRVATAV